MLADNIQFQFLPVRGSVPCTLLEGLDAQLGEVPDYQSVLVEDVCPTDYRAKYKFIQTMKNIGFEFQTALLTYTHGNNVGNLHFVWKVNAPNESSFSLSQPVIEKVKTNIPVYHTRTMRKGDVWHIWTSNSIVEAGCLEAYLQGFHRCVCMFYHMSVHVCICLCTCMYTHTWDYTV